MRKGGKQLVTWAVPGLLALALFLTGGGAALAAASLGSIAWLAWRLDNATGTFLVLAVLFLIVLGILAMMLALMAVVL